MWRQFWRVIVGGKAPQGRGLTAEVTALSFMLSLFLEAFSLSWLAKSGLMYVLA